MKLSHKNKNVRKNQKKSFAVDKGKDENVTSKTVVSGDSNDDSESSNEKHRLRLKLSKWTIFASVLLFIQLIVLYALTYWGYHNSKLPYSFDNFVQSNSLWRIYGVKKYGEVAFNEDFLVDPRLEGIEIDQVIREVSGYLAEKKVSGKDGIEHWKLRRVEYPPLDLDVKFTDETKVFEYVKPDGGEKEVLQEKVKTYVVPEGAWVTVRNGYEYSAQNGLKLKQTYFVKVKD